MLQEGLTRLRVTVTVKAATGSRPPVVKEFSRNVLQWPVDVPITPRVISDADASVEVIVDAIGEAGPIAQARVASHFSPNKLRLLRVDLYRCPGRPDGFICAPSGCTGETCEVCDRRGDCVAVPLVDTTEYRMPEENSGEPSTAADADARVGAESESEGGVDAVDASIADATRVFDAGQADSNSGEGPREAGTAGPSDGSNVPANDSSTVITGPSDSGSSNLTSDSGTTSSTEVCTPNPCANGGTCSRTGTRCTCQPGFSGPNCQTDVCAPNPCLHGGTCSRTGGQASCSCVGYVGSRCETVIDGCANNPCGSPNTCVNGLNDYSCTCASGYLQITPKRCAPRFNELSTRNGTCALTSDRQGICWGLPDTPSSAPQRIPEVTSNVFAVAVGTRHRCALVASGSNTVPYCWGDNQDGALGNGSTTSSSIPVLVTGVSNSNSLALGFSHTCATTPAGQVYCWGRNVEGQLGDGTGRDSTRPVSVAGLSDALAIASGDYHTCALRRSGAVVCWGVNISGQLGDGTTNQANSPVAVSGLSGVTHVAAGYGHTCAVVGDGTVRCWGNNHRAELGIGAAGDSSSAPLVVPSVTQVVQIGAGSEHTCARTRDSRVFCWGTNSVGEFGDGTLDPALQPVEVTSSWPKLVQIAAGGNVTCGVAVDGNVFCSGANVGGQLGASTSGLYSQVPVRVIPP